MTFENTGNRFYGILPFEIEEKIFMMAGLPHIEDAHLAVVTTVNAWKEMRETFHKIIKMKPNTAEETHTEKTTIGHKGKLNLMVELINLLQNSNLSPYWQRKIQNEFSHAMWSEPNRTIHNGPSATANDEFTWMDDRISLFKDNQHRSKGMGNSYGLWSGDILMLLACYRNWDMGKTPPKLVHLGKAATILGMTWGDAFLNPNLSRGEHIDMRCPQKYSLQWRSDFHEDKIRDIFNPIRKWQHRDTIYDHETGKFSDLSSTYYNKHTDHITIHSNSRLRRFRHGEDVDLPYASLTYDLAEMEDRTVPDIKKYLKINKVNMRGKTRKADLVKLCFSF